MNTPSVSPGKLGARIALLQSPQATFTIRSISARRPWDPTLVRGADALLGAIRQDAADVQDSVRDSLCIEAHIAQCGFGRLAVRLGLRRYAPDLLDEVTALPAYQLLEHILGAWCARMIAEALSKCDDDKAFAESASLVNYYVRLAVDWGAVLGELLLAAGTPGAPLSPLARVLVQSVMSPVEPVDLGDFDLHRRLVTVFSAQLSRLPRMPVREPFLWRKDPPQSASAVISETLAFHSACVVFIENFLLGIDTQLAPVLGMPATSVDPTRWLDALGLRKMLRELLPIALERLLAEARAEGEQHTPQLRIAIDAQMCGTRLARSLLPSLLAGRNRRA
jgi:hypothetical protein